MKGKYSIGEIAKIIGIETHTIRFWSTEMNQYISPTIGRGGRRYYSDTDLVMFERIRDLIRVKGYTIGMIKKGLPDELNQSTDSPHYNECITNVQNKILYLLKLYEEDM